MYEAPLKIGVLSAVGTCIFLGAALLPSNPIHCLMLSAVGLFFLGMPVGNAFAALQLVFPNQVRGQVSALLMFVINLGGIGLGPLLPGLFNDYLFRNEEMVGPSVSLTMVLASLLMTWIVFPLTYRHYRRDYEALHSTRAAQP
jgi:MFS family permease